MQRGNKAVQTQRREGKRWKWWEIGMKRERDREDVTRKDMKVGGRERRVGRGMRKILSHSRVGKAAKLSRPRFMWAIHFINVYLMVGHSYVDNALQRTLIIAYSGFTASRHSLALSIQYYLRGRGARELLTVSIRILYKIKSKLVFFF